MTLFKSSIMMICIIINIAHAEFYEDVSKCILQLKAGFDYKYDSVASCLKHAIRHYRKGQHISVPVETVIDEDQNIATQQDYPLNYAEYYHRELITMISGRKVPKPSLFCTIHFKYDRRNCNNALKPFKDHAVEAVKVAFSDYTLDRCNELLESGDNDYVYIIEYMKMIIELCTAKNAIKPSEFCEMKMLEKYNLKELPKIWTTQ